MLLEYVRAALKRAHYKILEDGTYFGEIPSCRGVWASAENLESCRQELQEVLEGWLILKIRNRQRIPKAGRFYLNIPTRHCA